MTLSDWQLQTPVSAIMFDCDGTLSAIEGVNELAKKKGVHQEVAALTEKAMGESGMNAVLYHKRLQLIQPQSEEVDALGQHYYLHIVPHVEEVIRIFKRFNKHIYVVSAGLYPAVSHFAARLQIPQKNIYAVPITFDAQGSFTDFDRSSPLITQNGKRLIAAELIARHKALIHIGDGLNDYVTHDLVTRFIGYGGVYYREIIAKQCQYYIHTHSMSALLPFVLTQEEVNQLLEEEKEIYHLGLTAAQQLVSLLP